MTDSDDEPITLSADALAALQQFYAERDSHVEAFEKLKAVATQDNEVVDGNGLVDGDGDGVATVANGGKATVSLSMNAFAEDWNESQFWYSDETATLLAKQLLENADADTVIAVVSTPSVFIALKNLLSAGHNSPKPKVFLLEHDQRFAVFSEFVFYDFMKPIKLPGLKFTAHLKGSVDRMIVDPPFLSEDCQTKMAMTLRWMARNPRVASSPAAGMGPGGALRVLICTGERMEPLVTKLYRPLGVRTTTYEPVHKGLKNEFYCYANFECEAWEW
ncbi:Uu.00g138490.m01.CDS01 [Anthostomella pinea]|uniref:Protein-lysine N-methyltransferase EFM5 n=1 Tax=Anthostomella pinea TaxID=933095 RepID=A0AAI8YL30_9PEZI|nr:Uu.00g138490.m01.CDS01 [Anthostomella pinea]